MNSNSQKVVTRFAPSPTGFMHIGGIRTALFAWLWARKNNGTFILRIEDTDKKREVVGAVAQIQESLNWLGISWDFGPDKPGPFGSCIQSERLAIYKKYAESLIEKGLAYTDPYSQEELDAFRKQAEEKKIPFFYRNHRPENTDPWDGTKPLRFKNQNIKRTTWFDHTRGELSAGEEALEDFVLIKSDGFPTYNFCHVIDDIEMNVTHVMRGEEFIPSTPNFIALYEALGATRPEYVTLPPILGETGGKKLSKRDGSKDALEYRNEGYIPHALVNFLAFLGWNPGDEREVMTIEELISSFEIDRIQKSGARFNPEKLDWMNKEHMKLVAHEEAYKKMLEYFANENLSPEILERFKKLAPTAFDRANRYIDFYSDYKSGEYDYVVNKPQIEPKNLVWKTDSIENAKAHLTAILGLLEPISPSNWTPEGVKAAIWDYAEANGRGNVLWPLRYGLSGKDKSPDPFTLLYVLGKEESLSRLKGL